VVLETDAEVGQGWEGGKTPPFRVHSRQTSRDLSVTCPVSGLNLARRVSVWLDFARWALVSAARRGRPQERFALVFSAVRFGSFGRGFAALENRQRRKSLVGSNPTPSAFRNGFFSAVDGLLGLVATLVWSPTHGSHAHGG